MQIIRSLLAFCLVIGVTLILSSCTPPAKEEAEAPPATVEEETAEETTEETTVEEEAPEEVESGEEAETK